MFAKSLERSQALSAQIRGLEISKEYLCRVEGEFPLDEIEVTQPIEVFSSKIGVCGVDPQGKPCTTQFKRLSYNGKSSVVLAKPRHGRMHQIRVHLQFLGHPIVNDYLYNDTVRSVDWKNDDGDDVYLYYYYHQYHEIMSEIDYDLSVYRR